jgi:predicted transcriptional regulator
VAAAAAPVMGSQVSLVALSGTASAQAPRNLSKPRRCVTLYDMKTSALTIRLDPELDRQLDRLAKRSGRSRSEIARDALRRQLAVLQLEEARKQILPFAEARGYLTDEDVFREIS